MAAKAPMHTVRALHTTAVQHSKVATDGSSDLHACWLRCAEGYDMRSVPVIVSVDLTQFRANLKAILGGAQGVRGHPGRSIADQDVQRQPLSPEGLSKLLDRPASCKGQFQCCPQPFAVLHCNGVRPDQLQYIRQPPTAHDGLKKLEMGCEHAAQPDAAYMQILLNHA